MCNFLDKSSKDEQLVAGVKQGNDEALQLLIGRYIPMISAKSSKFSPTGESEDFIQEGLIALYSAAQVFDASISNFSVFANVCVDRALISYYRKNFRKKQIPSSEIVYFEDNFELAGKSSPESIVIEKEECELLSENIKKELSESEFKILLSYLAGNSYETIAEKFGLSVKNVNNSMYRARRKIESIR